MLIFCLFKYISMLFTECHTKLFSTGINGGTVTVKLFVLERCGTWDRTIARKSTVEGSWRSIHFASIARSTSPKQTNANIVCTLVVAPLTPRCVALFYQPSATRLPCTPLKILELKGYEQTIRIAYDDYRKSYEILSKMVGINQWPWNWDGAGILHHTTKPKPKDRHSDQSTPFMRS